MAHRALNVTFRKFVGIPTMRAFAYTQSISLLLLVATLVSRVAAQDAGATFFFGCRPGYYSLTFDDGPSAYTARLLDILKANDVKTTFFIVGKKLKGQERIVKRAFDEGHQIASHTHDHKSLSTLTADEIKYQITQNEAVIKSAIGYAPTYMRPPYGECNAACAKVLESLNQAVIQWNIDSDDWRVETEPARWPEILTNLFINELEGGSVTNDLSKGWISLQHDTLNFSIDYVEEAIKKARAMGYKMTTIEQCLANPPWPMYRGGKFSNATVPNATGTNATATNVTATSTSASSAKTSTATSASATIAAESHSAAPRSVYLYFDYFLAFLMASIAAALFPR